MSRERMTSAQAVILAGGKVQRMEHATVEIQKCLLPIDGQPVLGQTLEALVDAFGSVNVILCVAYLADDVIRYAEKNKPRNVAVQYVHDNGNSQTANIFRNLEPIIHEEFVGLPGDVIAEPRVYRHSLELLEHTEALATTALSPHMEEIETHGVAKIYNGRVTSVTFPPPLLPDTDHLREMDIWGLSKNFYDYARKHPNIKTMSGIIQQAVIDDEYIAVNYYDGKWVHVGYPEDLQKSMHK